MTKYKEKMGWGLTHTSYLTDFVQSSFLSPQFLVSSLVEKIVPNNTEHFIRRSNHYQSVPLCGDKAMSFLWPVLLVSVDQRKRTKSISEIDSKN